LTRNSSPHSLVNNAIESHSPSAQVIVLDYPRLFNGEDCNALTD
jgi:hypothetical protein